MTESFQSRIGRAYDAENQARHVAKTAIEAVLQRNQQQRITDLIEAWVEAHARRRVLEETGHDA